MKEHAIGKAGKTETAVRQLFPPEQGLIPALTDNPYENKYPSPIDIAIIEPGTGLALSTIEGLAKGGGDLSNY